MSKHLTADQAEGYAHRTMSAAELLAADDHLAQCDACRRQVRDTSQVDSTFTSLRADLEAHANTHQSHLPYEQMAQFVDDKLDDVDREIAQAHLETCATCKEDVRDLSIFKASMASSSEPSRKPAGAPVRNGLLPRWPWSFGWSAAAATVAALVFIVGAWLVWRQMSSPRTEVVQSQPTPAPASPPAISETPPQPTPEILLTLNDGTGQIALDKEGNIVGLQALSATDQAAVREALNSGHVNVPSLPELKGRTEKLLGARDKSNTFALAGPVGVVVETNRPTFRWQSLPGATGYIVSVYDSGLNEVAVSPSLTVTEWKSSSPLARSGVYTWQVTAIKDGERIVSPVAPAPEAKFKVLSQTEAAGLERARQIYAGSHLTLGVLYARAGLIAEARREFQALLKNNPDSPAARKLLQSLRAR